MKILSLLLLCSFISCSAFTPEKPSQKVVPAQEFSQAVKNGRSSEFSVHHMESRRFVEDQPQPFYIPPRAQLDRPTKTPEPISVSEEEGVSASPPQPLLPPERVIPPYPDLYPRNNPSLYPASAQGASLFTDHRAYQAMDVITIRINENTRGTKRAETDATTEFSLLTGITEFFGLETRKWAANNDSLDPTALIQANTSLDFQGDGETQREGTLSGQISAVIMEVLPNGLLRVEGTKIVSLNDEEEVLVISGLVRPRDVNSNNQVDSSRVANMRIDFYGKGVVAEQQVPGWGARLFRFIWPF